MSLSSGRPDSNSFLSTVVEAEECKEEAKALVAELREELFLSSQVALKQKREIEELRKRLETLKSDV